MRFVSGYRELHKSFLQKLFPSTQRHLGPAEGEQMRRETRDAGLPPGLIESHSSRELIIESKLVEHQLSGWIRMFSLRFSDKQASFILQAPGLPQIIPKNTNALGNLSIFNIDFY